MSLFRKVEVNQFRTRKADTESKENLVSQALDQFRKVVDNFGEAATSKENHEW